jgi:hypothetical protein
VSNALNSFLPSDVQADIGSPAFGSFYNSVYREYRIHIRFAKYSTGAGSPRLYGDPSPVR